MFPTDRDFETKVSFETEAVPIPEDPPFHILFLGDFSGRENLLRLGSEKPSGSRVIEIDRDNFEDVMRSLKVRLQIALTEADRSFISLEFRELEDFHPDKLFQKIPVFSELRLLREKLLNPDTFESAAREVRTWFESPKPETSETVDQADSKNSISKGDLLDDILSERKAESTVYVSANDADIELRRFIQSVVKPFAIDFDETEQAKLLDFIDQASSDLMRRILHNPDFQSLEATWRGLFFAVRRIETNRDLKLFVYDISKSELFADLTFADDLRDSAFYSALKKHSDESESGAEFALLCADFDIEIDIEDTAPLIRLSKISDSISAPCVFNFKSIDSLSVFCKNPPSDKTDVSAKLWSALRNSPEAASLGCLYPKFLLRLPFGKSLDPVESFEFEELTKIEDNLLWGNPSYIFASILAENFSSSGWNMSARTVSEIEDVPVFVKEFDGQPKVYILEENITRNQCDLLIEEGFMPLISFGSDIVKLPDIQSISFPPKRLAGRWT